MLISIQRAELRPLLAKHGPITVHLYPTWATGYKVKASKVDGCVLSKRIHAIGELSKNSSVLRIYRNRAGIATHSLVIDTDELPGVTFIGKTPFVY